MSSASIASRTIGSVTWFGIAVSPSGVSFSAGARVPDLVEHRTVEQAFGDGKCLFHDLQRPVWTFRDRLAGNAGA